MSETLSSAPSALDSDIAVSSAEYAGRLTEDEYGRWFKQDSSDDDSIANHMSPAVFGVFQTASIEREFEVLSKSSFILDNFFNLSNVMRQSVQKLAREGSSPLMLETLTRLSLRLPALDSSKVDGSSWWNIIFHYRDIAMEQSSESFREIANPVFTRVLIPYMNREDVDVTRVVVSMLAVLYDVELVVDLLQRWTAGARPGSPVDFVSVVENWESEFNELPLHWVVNLVGSSEGNE